MPETLYFYDLETSGVNSRKSRIMQFAGQRTNLDLEPVGEPDNIYIKLSRDILPDPEAVLVHGVTPQKTLQDGITEAEFVSYFDEHILKPDTIFVGFNNIRFDDEFMRFLFYRNFYDPYEWQWKNGCGRWDMLDTVRMTRALRPEGISWPNDSQGKASNRLELLTSFNEIEHSEAHTALGDVNATIGVAHLIKKVNPKLFDYMLDMRDKKKVKALVTAGRPFVYVSGRYESRFEKLSIAVMAGETKDGSGALVYDLRYNPETWAKKTDQELSDALNVWQEDAEERLPFKTLQYNRCPSVAPVSVIDDNSRERLKIDLKAIEKNWQLLQKNEKLVERVLGLFESKKEAYQTGLLPNEQNVEDRLYDGFIPDDDKLRSARLRSLKTDDLKAFIPNFKDERLTGLFPLYKARNFPQSLSSEERNKWEEVIASSLFSGNEKSKIGQFIASLVELSSRKGLTANQQYLLEELKLYAESITPAD